MSEITICIPEDNYQEYQEKKKELSQKRNSLKFLQKQIDTYRKQKEFRLQNREEKQKRAKIHDKLWKLQGIIAQGSHIQNYNAFMGELGACYDQLNAPSTKHVVLRNIENSIKEYEDRYEQVEQRIKELPKLLKEIIIENINLCELIE